MRDSHSILSLEESLSTGSCTYNYNIIRVLFKSFTIHVPYEMHLTRYPCTNGIHSYRCPLT